MPVSRELGGYFVSVLKTLKAAASLKDLASLLGFKPSALSYIVYQTPPNSKYTKFEIPKKNGGTRHICAPSPPLKLLQRHLANALYACRQEIDSSSSLRPLSHGFREGLSIVSNAKNHKRRKFVLNLDLENFFPTFNFGRVRGFFIKNNDFQLTDKVATLIAQIACYENGLPQGSPCSPIIADLIAHLLDVRLVRLAKTYGVSYSRYADDLTFSTNQNSFPNSLAANEGLEGSEWKLGSALTSTIQNAGYLINNEKTRMQLRTSRQLVTGLTVNSKVNIRAEYYRRARAMCNSLFETGQYHQEFTPTEDGDRPVPVLISELAPLEGILSHIHHVKDIVDIRTETSKKQNPTTARRLYSQFLEYRHFVHPPRPLIICEGQTDSIYLKNAIRKLKAFHPKLGEWDGNVFNSTISFFNYRSQTHKLLDIGGGTGPLKHLIQRYKSILARCKHRPLNHPVIVLIDNDKGASAIFSLIKDNYKKVISLESADLFFHIVANLYLVKTPSQKAGEMSCIENFFEPKLLKTKINGKFFNPDNKINASSEYGKVIFAEKVVRPNANEIDFSQFHSVIQRIVAAIDDYEKRLAAP